MKRFRQYRTNAAVRDKYADIHLNAQDFIYPYFVEEGEGNVTPIPTMPGINRYTPDTLLDDVKETLELGINKILLFGVIPTSEKDEQGSAAYSDHSLIVRTIKTLKEKYPALIIITDVCLCEYTNHGHCGLLHDHDVDNDTTLPLLAEMAYQHALAGADFVAPSAMMDGQVEAIRKKLNETPSLKTKILAYSAKYASAFYGPFRDAAESTPSFGDRKSYQQQDPDQLVLFPFDFHVSFFHKVSPSARMSLRDVTKPAENVTKIRNPSYLRNMNPEQTSQPELTSQPEPTSQPDQPFQLALAFKKTRIAPTPSGFLHLGNVLSFSITAALARKTGAAILLRIDDLDRGRVTTPYVQDIFDTLNYLGIPWDEGPRNYEEYQWEYSQVYRLDSYRK